MFKLLRALHCYQTSTATQLINFYRSILLVAPGCSQLVW